MRILIACGGTGGHIFPGLSLCRALKKIQTDAEILLVLDKRPVTALIVTEEFSHIYICVAPLRFKFSLQNPIIILKLLKGIIQSLKIVLSFKPDIVIGFGGYANFFPVFFAWVFRIKTIIHEQNVIPGRANRLLAYLVDEIAIGFAKTKHCFGINSFKVKLTGNPLKPGLAQIEKARAYEFLGLDSNKFTILVMGGSQGAHRINTAFVKAVNLIKHKSDFEIIHLCGEKDQLFLSNSYKDLGIKAKAFSFLGPMEYAYSAADIVISRAGAASISEIAFFGLPSILISYPYVRGHQMKNAGYLCENNAAILIEEKDLYPEGLKDRILELFNNPGLRESMNKNVLMFSKPRADESLAELVLNEAQAYGA